MTTHVLPSAVPPIASARLRADVADWLVTFTCSALVVTVCLLLSDEAHHWFVIPVMLCGGVIGLDALAWLRGRVDAFDPIGVLGMIGVHFYFMAPLLHVLTGYWMPFITPPDDWRPWIGQMAWLNAAGLLIYRLSRRWMTQAWPAVPTRTLWRLDSRRFPWVCGIAIVVATFVQLGVYAKFGGISGYIQAFTESPLNISGLGYVFIVSESVPILVIMAIAWWAQGAASRRTWFIVAGTVVTFIALKLFFGGFRGSRGHIVYGIFWVLGIVNYLIRPLPRKLFLFGAAAGLVFMYAYGFYKELGANALEALQGADVRAEMTETSHRTLSYVLLGDLGRSDSQAFVMYRTSPECRASQFRPVWGQTYLAAVAMLVPRAILPNRPTSAQRAGTDAFYGYGQFESGDMVSTFAYALTGEAMLNFGLIGGLLSFVVLAGIVVWARRWGARLNADDARQFFVPFVSSLTFMALLWEADILLFFTLKESLVAAVVLALSVRRVPREFAVDKGPSACN